MRVMPSVTFTVAMLGVAASGPASAQQQKQTDLEFLNHRATKGSPSESSDLQSMQLQQRMQRKSQHLDTLSDVSRKSSRTKKSIIKKMQP